ncbi:HAMP domain-containing sensor histidine kinase [Bacteroides sp. 214]|uniref:sensor histidine kinase n=1 Tax=Bacteroides sp. 214 TaxID=2302935 RepID=UPI001EF2C3A1|nr:HAMP domain-containing sensor histidine kinase [Bacteroides sp. 214]
MKGIDRSQLVKASLVFLAVIIAVSFLYVSHSLVRGLSLEERTKMEVWAEAMKELSSADEETNLNLVLKVLNSNNTIPVIVVADGVVQMSRNVELRSDSVSFLLLQVERLEDAGKYITIEVLPQGATLTKLKVYYDDSLILKRLSIYPYIQLGIVFAFIVIVLLALLSFKRAEQNKIWVGLSKETAHQLGTPVSSLMAWIELLRAKYPADDLLPSMTEDVDRLQIIANRFSKIGTTPELTEIDVLPLLEESISYIRRRITKNVVITKVLPDNPVLVNANAPLLSWVIENIGKNAVDAMDGLGTLTVRVSEKDNWVLVDITDTGKGIRRDKYNSVFQPGYTTKKRGWGLGLSLARRIIEEYHFGRIYIKDSEINKGTTFRIELKK